VFVQPAAIGMAGARGDPQFVGLRGQSYQVHGMHGAVYNIITGADMQVNARFVFLTSGHCPVQDSVPDTNCWSHPGSYMGAMSFQVRVKGVVHQLLAIAGPAGLGFSAISLDNSPLWAGAIRTLDSFNITVRSSRLLDIDTTAFTFQLSNSDNFINQAVSPRISLSQLGTHGLLGQTHSTKVYPSKVRHIQGEVDDYAIADNDLLGTNFVHNLFLK
jgi:hypothetical protein